ncbi:hypothetical protein D3C86_1082510 [compost metagenome]
MGRGTLECQIARERISARLPADRGECDLLPVHRHFRIGLQRHAAAKLRQADSVHDEVWLDVSAFERHIGAALAEIGGRDSKGTVHRKMRPFRREAQFRLGGRAEGAVELDREKSFAIRIKGQRIKPRLPEQDCGRLVLQDGFQRHGRIIGDRQEIRHLGNGREPATIDGAGDGDVGPAIFAIDRNIHGKVGIGVPWRTRRQTAEEWMVWQFLLQHGEERLHIRGMQVHRALAGIFQQRTLQLPSGLHLRAGNIAGRHVFKRENPAGHGEGGFDVIGGHTGHVEPVGLEFCGNAVVEDGTADLIAKRQTAERPQRIEIDFVAREIDGEIGGLAVGAPLQLALQRGVADCKLQFVETLIERRQ